MSSFPALVLINSFPNLEHGEGIWWLMPDTEARQVPQNRATAAWPPALSPEPSPVPSTSWATFQHRKSEMGANSRLQEAGGPFLDVMQPLQGEEVRVIGNK